MKSVIALVLFALLALQVHANEFDCSGTQTLVDYLMDGPKEFFDEVNYFPEEYVLETIEGWECAFEPLEEILKGNLVLSSLNCVWMQPIENPTKEDLNMAGINLRESLEDIFSCFPETSNEMFVSFKNNTDGEILRIELEDPYINQRTQKVSLIAVEYGYSKHRKNPLHTEINVRYSSPIQSPSDPFSNSLCGLLEEITDSAEDRFEYIIEDEYFSDRIASIEPEYFLDGAQRCWIYKRNILDPRFSCTWVGSQGIDVVEKLAENLSNKIESCFGSRVARTASPGKYLLENDVQLRIRTDSKRIKKGDTEHRVILTITQE